MRRPENIPCHCPVSAGMEDSRSDYGRSDEPPVVACITVAVFRCVVALLLSVMSWVAEGVTFGHLLAVGAGYPVKAVSSRVL